jgi:threonine/homoserine/homoserine lactone efflux protein
MVPPMEALLGLAGYSFVAAVTPGPNNVVLWGIGLRYGYRAAIPYLLGIPLGVGLMILGAAAGLGALINAVPALGIGLKVVGSVYLLYLAWQVVGIAAVEEADVASAPGFSQSVAFQFVNPKAWFFVLSAVAAFRPAGMNLFASALLMALVTMVIIIPSAGLWAVGGDALSRFISSPGARWAVNFTLAIVLVAMVILIWV